MINKLIRAATGGRLGSRSGSRCAGLHAFLAVLGLTACGAAGQAGPLIVIDGEFTDWDSVPAVVVDSLENGPGMVDFGELRIESDDDAVYFAIDLGRTVNVQAMQGSVHLVLDSDGDPATGRTIGGLEGADRVIALSPARPDSPVGQGLVTRLAGDSAWTHTYDIGLMFAPTFASRYTELRIARGTAGAITGSRLRGRLVYFDVTGDVADEVESFEVPLRASSGRAAVSAPAADVARSEDASFRLVSWNVSDRGPVEATDAFGRVIGALDPDVVMFDEVSPGIDAAWFEQTLSNLAGEWTVVRGLAGGRQTSVIASRLPIRSAPDLVRIDYADSIFSLRGQSSTPQLQRDLATGREDAMPASGAIVEIRGARILLLTLDLQCCGHAGSTEDRARVMMADALRQAVARSISNDDSVAGVVIAGDLNLVGSRQPLDVLGMGLDPAGGDLVPVPSMRLNGVSMATWQSPGPFPPGRLDFVLHAPSSLTALRSFAFDPADLSDAARSRLGVQSDDSRTVSDHLPVVVDFAVRF